METFQLIESNSDDVVCVIKESQMQHSKVIAAISLTNQVTRPESSIHR